jgi:hypothetical protein
MINDETNTPLVSIIMSVRNGAYTMSLRGVRACPALRVLAFGKKIALIFKENLLCILQIMPRY